MRRSSPRRPANPWRARLTVERYEDRIPAAESIGAGLALRAWPRRWRSARHGLCRRRLRRSAKGRPWLLGPRQPVRWETFSRQDPGYCHGTR